MEISDKLTKLLSSKKRKSSGYSEETDSEKLDQFLATSCRQFFSHKVEFHRVESTESHLDYLKAQYKPLNPVPPPEKANMNGENAVGSNDGTQNNSRSGQSHMEDIPKPKRDIYPVENVVLEWKCAHGVGSGLTNLGNTCFLNSVLQCLLYTPPLYNYLTSMDHKQKCMGWLGLGGRPSLCTCVCRRVVGKGWQISKLPLLHSVLIRARKWPCFGG